MKTIIRVKSKSHKIEQTTFEHLNGLEFSLTVKVINENLLELAWEIDQESELYNEYHDHHCSIMFNSFLASLNISSLGLFYWHDGTEISPVLLRGSEEQKIFTIHQDHKQRYEVLRDLTENDVKNALIFFPVLSKSHDKAILDEYLKGIMLLSISFYDINFHREAYSNFYRLIEFIVTNRILGKQKLKKELYEMESVFRNHGVDDKLLAEFKEVYIKRGSQVMHAQLQPEAISFDDVIIAKSFADILLNKYCRNIAEDWRKNRSVNA
jgi:hypothetical protein